MSPNSKAFVLLDHDQFLEITSLMTEAKDNEIKQILKTATHVDASPIKDGMIVQAMLYNGDILIDMSGER